VHAVLGLGFTDDAVEMLDSIYLADRRGMPARHRGWTRLSEVTDWLSEHWDQPEEGIWETQVAVTMRTEHALPPPRQPVDGRRPLSARAFRRQVAALHRGGLISRRGTRQKGRTGVVHAVIDPSTN
jgi:hypothetical protein